jgi:cytoskeletal protein CcmA (bactofilin family)
VSRYSARVGSSVRIKGEITGSENLEIDGIVEGPISLDGHELTVGPTAQLNSEIHAGEVVVNGKVVGNVHAWVRVEITKHGSITGDIACARVSIEDGAHFKGRNCYGRADFTGDRAAQMNWLSLSERIRWQVLLLAQDFVKP